MSSTLNCMALPAKKSPSGIAVPRNNQYNLVAAPTNNTCPLTGFHGAAPTTNETMAFQEGTPSWYPAGHAMPTSHSTPTLRGSHSASPVFSRDRIFFQMAQPQPTSHECYSQMRQPPLTPSCGASPNPSSIMCNCSPNMDQATRFYVNGNLSKFIEDWAPGGYPSSHPSHMTRSGFTYHPHELALYEHNSRPDQLDIVSINDNQTWTSVTNASGASPSKALPTRPTTTTSSPPPLPPRSQHLRSVRSCSQGRGKKKQDLISPWNNWSPTAVENRVINSTVSTQTLEPLSNSLQVVAQSPAKPRKQFSSTGVHRPSSLMPGPEEVSVLESRRNHCLKPPTSPLVSLKPEATQVDSIDNQPPAAASRSCHKAKSPSPMHLLAPKQTKGGALLKSTSRRMSADRQISPSDDIFRQNMHKLSSAVTASTGELKQQSPDNSPLDPPSNPHSSGGERDEDDDDDISSSSSLTSSSECVSLSDGDRICSNCRQKTPSQSPEKTAAHAVLTASTPVFTVKRVNPAVYRRFIEQKFANVGRVHKEREERQAKLEAEMLLMGLSEASRAHMRKMLQTKESNYLRMQRARMDESMFTRISRLGVGAFGWVWLVRKKENRQLYAMKILKKHDVVRRRQLAHVQAERDILAEADSEWVVKLFFSFQDAHALYLVMEYIPGGDMMSLLIKKEIFEERLARFYIAELTLALESVHSLGFIHRDIKPDNILVTREGHIKLTDFGLCTSFRWTHSSKYWEPIFALPQPGESSPTPDPVGDTSSAIKFIPVTHDQTLERRVRSSSSRRCAKSLVGTPNYIAPEILRRQEYNQACDWWSVGVILYEMLVGRPPFVAQTALDTQIRVVQWPRYLRIPGEPRLAATAGDLIRQLLCDPEDRLANPGQLKIHPFFADINWETLPSQTPPHVPTLLNELDTSNFDDAMEEEGKEGRNSEGSSGGLFGFSSAPHSFPDFTFKRFFDQATTGANLNLNSSLSPLPIIPFGPVLGNSSSVETGHL